MSSKTESSEGLVAALKEQTEERAKAA